ncbi:MAG: LysR family transcriptional regulator [Pseudomonadota bacterium]
MDNWMAVRTALYVARLGTVSAAAKELKIHRATVIRHIDELEQGVGGKLFQRHARGYHLTEAGEDFLNIASATEDQLVDLAGRIRGKSNQVLGKLIVTSVEIMDDYLLPAIQEFSAQHPDTNVMLQIGNSVLNLEYGEAHVAIRAGRKPRHPDNVVLPLMTLKTGLYAHKSYLNQHGPFGGVDDIPNHRFIGDTNESSDVPFRVWMRKTVPPENVVFVSNKSVVQRKAVHAGIGLGFLPKEEALKNRDLIEVMPSMRSWITKFWITTHVDLHRTGKVQAFLNVLKTTFSRDDEVSAIMRADGDN